MSSSGSVRCALSVGFDRCRRFRRTPVRACCFVASRACFTPHLDKRWIAGMSFRAVELEHCDNNTFFIARAYVLMAFRVDSSVVQKTKEMHSARASLAFLCMV